MSLFIRLLFFIAGLPFLVLCILSGDAYSGLYKLRKLILKD